MISLNMAAEGSKTNETAHPPPVYDDDDDNTYHIKWIDWFDEKIPIITQNKNGPCPLLAIFNVLLLSKRVSNCATEFLIFFYHCQ